MLRAHVLKWQRVLHIAEHEILRQVRNRCSTVWRPLRVWPPSSKAAPRLDLEVRVGESIISRHVG